MTALLQDQDTLHSGAPRKWGKLRRSTAIAALVAGAIAFPATAAVAAVSDTDPLTVTDTKVDFGSSSGLSTTNGGIPLSAATAVWTSAPGQVSVQVKGAVYYDGPRSESGCASVRVTLYDSAGNRLVTNYSEKACRDGFGSFVGKGVSYTMSNPAGTRLRVVARHSSDGGITWVEGKYTDVFLGGA